MAQVVRDKTMKVTSKALFDTITDFKSYPKFLPEVKSAEVKSGGSPKKKLVTFEIEVVKRFSYTLEFLISEPSTVSWKLVDSNFFKTNEGKWELKEKGKSTDVHYELEVGFGFFVPGFITKTLTEVNLPKMFDSFEKEAMSRKE